MQGKYEATQAQALRFGLRSAKLDGAFMSLNSSLATGVVAGGGLGNGVRACVARALMRSCMRVRVRACVRFVVVVGVAVAEPRRRASPRAFTTEVCR